MRGAATTGLRVLRTKTHPLISHVTGGQTRMWWWEGGGAGGLTEGGSKESSKRGIRGKTTDGEN